MYIICYTPGYIKTKLTVQLILRKLNDLFTDSICRWEKEGSKLV